MHQKSYCRILWNILKVSDHAQLQEYELQRGARMEGCRIEQNLFTFHAYFTVQAKDVEHVII
jgi:hypothetical protein